MVGTLGSQSGGRKDHIVYYMSSPSWPTGTLTAQCSLFLSLSGGLIGVTLQCCFAVRTPPHWSGRRVVLEL